MTGLRTCVTPSGKFVFGIHKPSFRVHNLREGDYIASLGNFPDGASHLNTSNFPPDEVEVSEADVIYEIHNPFPFRGATYIARSWAETSAENIEAIGLPPVPSISFSSVIDGWFGQEALSEARRRELFESLPRPFLLAVANTSSDPRDLTLLAAMSCELIFDPESATPSGLKYLRDGEERIRPAVNDRSLFEVVANNPCLPDAYKRVMVLCPGAQGGSEIVGERRDDTEGGHAFEYLRKNSYIPWGHYAANMAHDSVRYRLGDLSLADMRALRHLYCQRTYVRLAAELGIALPPSRRALTEPELESLRLQIVAGLDSRPNLFLDGTLWGWNLGFDFTPTRYRLHASHQQIHQQYALVPASVAAETGGGGGEAPARIPTFACGDLVADFIADYRKQTGRPFFEAYIEAIKNNQRMDGRPDRNGSLIVWEADGVMVFVPKAQTSQWELQMMPLDSVGNIVEADSRTRGALDRGMLVALGVLSALGARLVTNIEYAKRLGGDQDQRLVYAFLPKLPESMGAFTEAELRWINGHYPEDFAAACRAKLAEVLPRIVQEG